MNKLGIFMNFWERNWAADHRKYIKKAAEIGFDILEFQVQPLLEMSDRQICELKRVADDAGIELTYSLGLDCKYDVSSLDETVRKGGVEYLKKILSKIHVADGRLLSGVSYAGWGIPQNMGDSKMPYWEQSVKSMKEVIQVAEDHGITYCVEAVNRFEGCLINTAKEAVRYVAEIGSKNMGVLLDTFHMNIEEDNLGEAIRYVGADRLKGVHTGDNNRRAPGRGHINWDEVFLALADIGYKGHIVSEPFVMQGGEVGRDIHIYRDLIENPCEAAIDAEAKYLLDFERSMLTKYGMA